MAHQFLHFYLIVDNRILFCTWTNRTFQADPASSDYMCGGIQNGMFSLIIKSATPEKSGIYRVKKNNPTLLSDAGLPIKVRIKSELSLNLHIEYIGSAATLYTKVGVKFELSLNLHI